MLLLLKLVYKICKQLKKKKKRPEKIVSFIYNTICISKYFIWRSVLLWKKKKKLTRQLHSIYIIKHVVGIIENHTPDQIRNGPFRDLHVWKVHTVSHFYVKNVYIFGLYQIWENMQSGLNIGVLFHLVFTVWLSKPMKLVLVITLTYCPEIFYLEIPTC